MVGNSFLISQLDSNNVMSKNWCAFSLVQMKCIYIRFLDNACIHEALSSPFCLNHSLLLTTFVAVSFADVYND